VVLNRLIERSVRAQPVQPGVPLISWQVIAVVSRQVVHHNDKSRPGGSPVRLLDGTGCQDDELLDAELSDAPARPLNRPG
jgi:hypothetical protein